MRSVFVRGFSAALLLLIVVGSAIPVLADEPPPGTDAPQARIHVPVGVTGEEEEASIWELFLVWLEEARIHVPVG
jgi:hypothetical protein